MLAGCHFYAWCATNGAAGSEFVSLKTADDWLRGAAQHAPPAAPESSDIEHARGILSSVISIGPQSPVQTSATAAVPGFAVQVLNVAALNSMQWGIFHANATQLAKVIQKW